MESPKKIFGFDGQNRYSYCPSAVLQSDGAVQMWFCGNPQADIMVDNIYHMTVSPSGNYSGLASVLQPGSSGSWDDHHTCDPSIIQGEFKWGQETWKYAMFFLGNRYPYYYNEIGVAFSNDMSSSSWKKYPEQIVTKTWQEDGDQSIGGSGKSWGTGQPSAVSLDKKGKVLLTYTVGDLDGTRIVWQELDLSDIESISRGPVRTMAKSGLLNYKGGRDVTCNSDIAVSLVEDKIVMIRPVGSDVRDYPTYLPVAQEIDWMNFSDFMAGRGSWQAIYRITQHDTGFPRNHNAALERDAFGHIKDWKHPVFYYTVSKAAPDVSAETGNHAEWTYDIYRSKIYDTVVQVPSE